MTMEIPEEKEEDEPEDEGKKEIQGYFSQEFYIDRSDLAKFLRNVADEIEEDGEMKLSTDEWELPFNAKEGVELEIELGDDELEIEMEFEEAKNKGKELSVE